MVWTEDAGGAGTEGKFYGLCAGVGEVEEVVDACDVFLYERFEWEGEVYGPGRLVGSVRAYIFW